MGSLVGKVKDEEFVSLYNELKSARKVGDRYGVCHRSILEYAKKIGYETKKSLILTKDDEKDIIEQYAVKTAKELSSTYNCSISQINKVWMLAGLRGKNNRSQYFDFDYFDNVSSSDRAYFIGFIAADGCIYDRGKENCQKWLRFTLNKDDREILDVFSNCLGGNVGISEFKTTVTITLVSDKICSDLSKYGIVERKTKDLVVKNIPSEYIWHFIRGYFDGDGSICKRGTGRLPSDYTFSISCHGGMKDVIGNIFNENGIEFYAVRDKRTDNFYSVVVKKNAAKLRLYYLLYKNCKNLFLTRKKRIYENFIDAVSSRNR